MATYPEIGSPAAPAAGIRPEARPDTPTPSPVIRHSSPSGGQDSLQQQSSGTTQNVSDQARDMMGQVKEQARTQIAGQKEKAAQHLGGIENALRQTSDTLRQNDESRPLADYVERAAEQVSHLNQYLRNHTVNELMGEAERYARREPALFIGGAALLGLAAARFFRASTSPRGNGPSSFSSHRGDAYPPIHNTAGASLPQARPQERHSEFVASTSDLTPTEGRYNG